MSGLKAGAAVSTLLLHMARQKQYLGGDLVKRKYCRTSLSNER